MTASDDPANHTSDHYREFCPTFLNDYYQKAHNGLGGRVLPGGYCTKRCSLKAVRGWYDSGDSSARGTGHKMRTYGHLLDEMAAVQFPHYFGENCPHWKIALEIRIGFLAARVLF